MAIIPMMAKSRLCSILLSAPMLRLCEPKFKDHSLSISGLLPTYSVLSPITGAEVDLNSLSKQDLQDYLLFVMDRLISNQRVLFGTPETCREQIELFKAAGVDEIACQMDFGIDINLILHLPT